MRVPHRHWAGQGPVVNSVSQAGRPPALRLLAVVGCALLGNATLSLPRSAAWAQSVSSATVTEVLDSNQVFIQNQRAAVNSVAQRQQRVRTQDARASLRFNNGAVARLAHNSSLMVGQCAQLNRGTLLVNGSLNGCSTTTMAGVRGTLYTLEISEDGETIVKVFEGEVIVGQRTDAPMPEPPDDLDDEGMEGGRLDDDILKDGIPEPNSNGNDLNGQDSNDADSPFGIEIDLSPQTEDTPAETSETVEFNPDTVLVINEGQQVTVNAESDEAVIANLTAEDFINLLEGPLVRGFVMDLPGLSDLESAFRRLFPGIPLPFGLPSINIPLPPVRFPF